MTIWNFVGIWFGLGAYAVAWTWGGRAERFAAGLSLLYCLCSSMTYTWEVGGFHLASFIENCVRLLIFGWLCFRSNRWWLFVMTVAIALKVLVVVIALFHPALSAVEAMSAEVGLGYLVDLTLLLSPLERRLAGEAPAGSAAWAAAKVATAARRKRREQVRLPGSALTASETGGQPSSGRNSTFAVSS